MRIPFAHLVRVALTLAAGFLLGARIGRAQTVSGRVTAEIDGAPLASAIVALIDSAGHAVMTKLAADSGTFAFHAPVSGRYSVRAERVGFESTLSARLLVRQGDSIYVPIAMTSQAVSLRGIVVNADRRCLVRPKEGVATAQLWNEARKALVATQYSQMARAATKTGRNPHRFVVRWRSTQRDLSPNTLAVLRSDEVSHEGETMTPFASVDAERLARDGYMIGDPNTGATFFAPDADILLSDRFLDSHCFQLQAPVGDRRDELIGLAFEPVNLTTDRRDRRVDVHGVLWLDRASAELRYMEYKYTNLPPEQTSPQVGGLLEFRPLPDGRWIVWRWYIRSPAVVRRAAPHSLMNDWRTEIASIHEDGAEVLEVMPAGTRHTSVARLRGTVIDSMSDWPMAGVRVFLSGTSFAAVSRPDGSYLIESIPPGRYDASIIAPRLDSLLLDPPVRALTLSAGEDKQLDLALPSIRTMSAQVCTRAMPDTSSMIIGVVRDSGAAASGVHVRAEWTEYTKPAADRLSVQPISSETTTGANGRYSLCGVPTGTKVTLRAIRGGASVASPQRATAPGEVRRVDLMLRKPQ